MQKIKFITYDGIKNIFEEAKSDISPEELHGIQTGIMCVAPDMDLSKIVDILYKEFNCEDKDELILSFISYEYDKIIEAFDELNFSFNLFLPSDDSPLIPRIKALSDWCRGFLSGIGLSGLRQESMSIGVLKEAISDINDIAHLKGEPEDTQEEEDAYIELVDYVTILVQNIHAELNLTEDSSEAKVEDIDPFDEYGLNVQDNDSDDSETIH